MSTNNPKYPTSAGGYLAYLFDTGAIFSVNPTNLRVINVVANYDGHKNYIAFLLDKNYTDSITNIKNNILTNKYEIVNMRMY